MSAFCFAYSDVCELKTCYWFAWAVTLSELGFRTFSLLEWSICTDPEFVDVVLGRIWGTTKAPEEEFRFWCYSATTEW